MVSESSAWPARVLVLHGNTMAACGLQICWEPGSRCGGKSFQGPKSNPWETAGFGGLGAVGRDRTASLLINGQQRAGDSERGGGIKSHAAQKAAWRGCCCERRAWQGKTGSSDYGIEIAVRVGSIGACSPSQSQPGIASPCLAPGLSRRATLGSRQHPRLPRDSTIFFIRLNKNL